MSIARSPIKNANAIVPTALSILVFAAGCSAWLPASAGGVDIKTVNSRGVPVKDAVISLERIDPRNSGDHTDPSRPLTAVMDQRNKEFVPHVLAVYKGTAVTFPNSDNIRHHVYSFSPAKQFELRLYSGTPAHPVVFDKAGIVALGCNIHDWMLGYIDVLDTPWFAKSDEDGKALIRDVPPGPYQLHIWHPRLLSADQQGQRITISATGRLSETVSVSLSKPTDRHRPDPTDNHRFDRFHHDRP